MAFNPNSIIYMCNVPFDSSYRHQVYFENVTEQNNYFSNKVVKTFTNYLTIRSTGPNGSLKSSVKVDANIDELRALGCNYMYYKNQHYTNKIFYAFIKNMVYVNEHTTEIVFESDVFQTWFLDVQIMQSYVVREHSRTDVVGDNVVPEAFNFQDFIYEEAIEDGTLDDWGYLVATTELNFELPSNTGGHIMSGIYQGLYFFYYDSITEMTSFFDSLEKDSVEFVCVIPKFNVSAQEKGALWDDAAKDQGWIFSGNEPATKEIEFTFDESYMMFDGYIPKNKKLFTSPFLKLIVTNNQGEQAEYNIEDFQYNESPKTRTIKFKMYGDISANPSITLIPLNYKKLEENYEAGLSISGFPQCAYMNDYFKLWLTKNQYGIALDVGKNLASIGVGLATIGGTGGLGTAVGGGMIASGAGGILNTLNNTYQATKEPNRSQSGSAKNNLLTAIKKNKFCYYWQRIKKEYAKTVDDFFTMYGYQVNKLKEPNLSSRPLFNYVQTVDVNIKGKPGKAIPQDDMNVLKNIFNAGVTLWKPTATMYAYNLDNSPEADE